VVARVLGVPLESVDPSRPISSYGLDSLTAIEIKDALETELSLTVPMAALLEGISVEKLTERVRPLPAPESLRASEEGPVTAGQEALWFLHQLSASSGAYLVVRAARVKSALDEAALRRALTRLTERHPALRTAFVSTPAGPRQRVHAGAAIDLLSFDAAGWTEAQRRQALLAESARGFELERPPLMRVRLWRGGDETALLVSMHHLVTDLWSFSVLLRELGDVYREEMGGPRALLPALERAPIDVARAEQAWLQSDEGRRLLERCAQRLTGVPRLALPTDRRRPPTKRFRGATSTLSLGPATSDRLRALCAEHQVTPFVALQAVLQVLLWRYSGQARFGLGTMTTGRTQAGQAGLIGYFVNPVALVADLSGNPTVSDLLERVRRATLAAFTGERVPFSRVVERLQPVRDTSRSPLFDVALVVQ
jgi:acyl carrier protein